jgi:hypothetical protein
MRKKSLIITYQKEPETGSERAAGRKGVLLREEEMGIRRSAISDQRRCRLPGGEVNVEGGGGGGGARC